MCCLVGKQPNSLTRGQPLIPPAPSPPAKALGAKGGQAVGSSSPPAKAPGAKGGQAVGSSSLPPKALGRRASTVWRQVATRGRSGCSCGPPPSGGRWLRAAGGYARQVATRGRPPPPGGRWLRSAKRWTSAREKNSPTRQLNYPARLRPPNALGSCLRPSDR